MSTLIPARTGPTITTALNLSATKLTPMCNRGPKRSRSQRYGIHCATFATVGALAPKSTPTRHSGTNRPTGTQKSVKMNTYCKANAQSAFQNTCTLFGNAQEDLTYMNCLVAVSKHIVLNHIYRQGPLFSQKSRWDNPSDWEQQPLLQLGGHMFALDPL